jgi:hypothetical protein
MGLDVFLDGGLATHFDLAADEKIVVVVNGFYWGTFAGVMRMK